MKIFFLTIINILFLCLISCLEPKYEYCKNFNSKDWSYSECTIDYQKNKEIYQIFFNEELDIPIRCELIASNGYIKKIWYQDEFEFWKRYEEYDNKGKIIYSIEWSIYGKTNEINYNPNDGSKISEDIYIYNEKKQIEEIICNIKGKFTNKHCLYYNNDNVLFLEEIYDTNNKKIEILWY